MRNFLFWTYSITNNLRNEFACNAIKDYVKEFKCITIIFPPLVTANVQEKCVHNNKSVMKRFITRNVS